MKNKYYALEVNGKEADIYIFGDIVTPLEKEFWGFDSDVSGYSLVQEIRDLDVDVINVHINSYGGVVSEGLAIRNALREHKAKVRTIVDGFACSAASVVFMAGEERLMNDASLLMIHNAWMRTEGNAAQLRKDADDLDKITQGSIEAYMARVNISEEKVKELMDAETWILPSEALEWGFATGIITAKETNKAAASARKALFNLVAKRESAEISIDTIVNKTIVDKLYERLTAEINQMEYKLINGTGSKEPIGIMGGETNEGSADGESPKENKPIKFLSALMR